MHHSFFKFQEILTVIINRPVERVVRGGGLDHVSRKIKRSFHNSRKIKQASRFTATMEITIHEEKISHLTFHAKKKGRSRVTKIPFTTLCREVHRILETSIVQESKKNHVPHVLSDGLGVKIRNEFKFKSVFKGRPQITMTLSRLWCPAVLVKTRVWMGRSVLQAHKTWSQSFLLKDFRICIKKSFRRREYSDRPGCKYRGFFFRESSVSKKK